MRSFLAVVLTLCLVGTAGAATIRGTARGELLPGTLRGDLLIPGAGRDVVDAVDGNDRIVLQYDGAIDTVSCGAGRDIVNADLADRVARDCEVVSRRLSRDIYANADSSHETQVEPDSFTFGRTTVAVFQTGRRFEGAAANIAFATSTDNGLTWRGGELPGITKLAPRPGTSERASDPVVAYDALHRVWLASSLAVSQVASQPTRLTINRSPDGLSWSDPLDAASATLDDGIAYDKQWLACDNGLAEPLPRPLLSRLQRLRPRRGSQLQTSTDGGLTWSQPVTVTPLSLAGAFPAIQPDGTLVIVYKTGTGNRRELAAVRSRDGGASLEAPVLVSPIQAFVVGLRLPVLPAVDVDRTGRILVTWHDCGRRPSCVGNDVVVSTSTDGIAWSAPRRITSGRIAAIPTIAADPTTDRLAILYYAVGPSGIDTELVESRNGGATWSAPSRLSAQTMQRRWIPETTQGRMLADYISISYAAGRPLAVWALASEPAGGELRQAIFATRL